MPVANAVGGTSAAALPAFGGRPAIAVLPFENLSQDPEQEYFADGLTEDLINRMSLFRAFPVISRNSTFTWKGKAIDVRAVAADLGVRYVVQGSIRKSGPRVRIAAKLVDASTGQQAWAQTYDRDLTDVFAVQDEISEAIAASLVLDLNRSEHELARRRDPASLEAWGLYQRALPLIYRFTREDHEAARELLERAVALDPQFAPAVARLGEIHIWDIILGYSSDFDASIAAALAQSRRAVEADPRDAEARSQLAWALMTAGQGFAAVEEVRHAYELNPGNPWVLLIFAWLRAMTGPSPQEAIEYVERARRLSPRDPAEWLFYDVQAGAFMIANRFEDALASARRLIQLWPGYTFGHVWCAMALASLGRPDEAREAVRRADAAMPGITIASVLQMLGAIAPEVSRHFSDALARAGMP
jgi:TolB-like protein